MCIARDVTPAYGPRPWSRIEPGEDGRAPVVVDEQVPETCTRCGGLARNTWTRSGALYCAACHWVPGGEFRAYKDDRVSKEEKKKLAEEERAREAAEVLAASVGDLAADKLPPITTMKGRLARKGIFLPGVGDPTPPSTFKVKAPKKYRRTSLVKAG